MQHELKIWPEYFDDIQSGKKPFDVRKADRPFGIGDTLLLKEWSPDNGYSGRETIKRIKYILPGGQFGIHDNSCVLGLESEQTTSFLKLLRMLSVQRAKEGFKTYDNQPITYWTTAVIGEFGELCNMIKKMQRVQLGGVDGGHSYTAKNITPKMIREELGGTLLYIDLLASLLGVDLEEAITETFNEKSKELGFDFFLPE